MIYDDFSLPSNSTFEQMNKEFLSRVDFDKSTTINKIFILLCECKNMCQTRETKNPELLHVFNDIQTELNKEIENFLSLFNFNLERPKFYFEFNPFSMSKKLCEIEKLSANWLCNEKREYHKNFVNSFLNNIISLNINLLETLSKLNIKIFNYM